MLGSTVSLNEYLNAFTGVVKQRIEWHVFCDMENTGKSQNLNKKKRKQRNRQKF